MKAYSKKASLLKSLPPGVGWDHNRGDVGSSLCRKNILKIFTRITAPKEVKELGTFVIVNRPCKILEN
jgi:hypothetical protein